MGEIVDPEDLARLFHEAYERLAPEYGYKTREETAVSWSDVPDANKNLMIAVCKEILDTHVVLVYPERGGNGSRTTSSSRGSSQEVIER